MTTLHLAAASLFTALNLFAFVLMGWDKHRSFQTGAERISEAHLFFLAIIGGSLGVFLGMFAFRHKTRTSYFLIGIPLAGAQNIVFIYSIMRWLLPLYS